MDMCYYFSVLFESIKKEKNPCFLIDDVDYINAKSYKDILRELRKIAINTRKLIVVSFGGVLSDINSNTGFFDMVIETRATRKKENTYIHILIRKNKHGISGLEYIAKIEKSTLKFNVSIPEDFDDEYEIDLDF